MNASVRREHESIREVFEWGELVWYANAKLGNSEHVTLARCTIKRGHSNPRHRHPNCSEVLHLERGRLVVSLEGDEQVELQAGDSITFMPNQAHGARSTGAEDAVMWLVYSSPSREYVSDG